MKKTLYLKFVLAYFIFGVFAFITVTTFVPGMTKGQLVRDKAESLYSEAVLSSDQYATGLSAAIAFANKILKEGKPAVDRYVTEFLSGGCSKDPIDLLKAAGVDMSTPEPIDSALNVFEEYLELLKKQLEK